MGAVGIEAFIARMERYSRRLDHRIKRRALLKLQRQDMAECAERWRSFGERRPYRDIAARSASSADIRLSGSGLDAAPAQGRVEHAKRRPFRRKSVVECMAAFPRGQRPRKAKPGRLRR
jgi:hypothetical protein